MNVGQEKGTGTITKFCLSPCFFPAGRRNKKGPGNAGSLMRRAIVCTCTLLYIDPEMPDCVDLEKTFT